MTYKSLLNFDRVKGNLLDLAEEGKFDIIVQGCNCQNVMGSGIAKEIKSRYPEVYQADFEYDEAYDFCDRIEKLGTYSTQWIGGNGVWFFEKGFLVVNAYTQFEYNRTGKPWVDHFDYEAFTLILRKLAYQYKGKKFGFPYIGMGRAGGDAKKIIKALDDFAGTVMMDGGSVTLVTFKET
jgi:O-acetyl-ADP-ribose deacetylase (regulator of RNase III)